MKVLSIIPPSTPCLTILITVRHFFARNTFLLKNNWECISVVKTVIFRRQISFETIYVNLLTKALTHKKLLANISASNKHRLLSMSWLKKYFQSETCAEVGDASLLNVLFWSPMDVLVGLLAKESLCVSYSHGEKKVFTRFFAVLWKTENDSWFHNKRF